MVKRKLDWLIFFFHLLPVVFLCLSGCAGKTKGKSSAHGKNLSFESEIRMALNQLDSFDPNEREKGSRSIVSSKYLEKIHTLSDSIDTLDENSSLDYIDIIGKTVTEIRPVVPALFNSALDIHTDVKKNSFYSLQKISSCLLKVILTTYSIKNNNIENKEGTAVYYEAEELLKNAKSLNEEIITFFRNKAHHSRNKTTVLPFKKTAVCLLFPPNNIGENCSPTIII